MSTRQSSSYLSNFRLQGYNGIEDVDSWLERFELLLSGKTMMQSKCTKTYNCALLMEPDSGTVQSKERANDQRLCHLKGSSFNTIFYYR
jgi:hypothetical protein